MSGRWRARDHSLLDVLDALPRRAVNRRAWRVVRGDRDPLLCRPSGGRWDLGHFDVLYTSLEPAGAVSEMHFHLSRQPVFPSTVEFSLSEIEVTTRETVMLGDLSDLEPLGVEPGRYSSILYERTQEIGDAAAFLGFDGIIIPSARWDCLNLVIFCDSLTPHDLVLRSSSTVGWEDWREKLGRSIRNR